MHRAVKNGLWTSTFHLWQPRRVRWRLRRCARVALFGALGICLAGPLGAAEEAEDAPDAVIPPGQEELLLLMLGKGASLPDGCTLSDGQIDRTVVKATYACPLGDVIIQLSNPEQAPEKATETERFALVVDSGAPPESLLDALAASVRARESGFEWLRVAEVPAPALDGAIGERFAPGEPRW